jgi:hypothetical protein
MSYKLNVQACVDKPRSKNSERTCGLSHHLAIQLPGPLSPEVRDKIQKKTLQFLDFLAVCQKFESDLKTPEKFKSEDLNNARANFLKFGPYGCWNMVTSETYSAMMHNHSPEVIFAELLKKNDRPEYHGVVVSSQGDLSAQTNARTANVGSLLQIAVQQPQKLQDFCRKIRNAKAQKGRHLCEEFAKYKIVDPQDFGLTQFAPGRLRHSSDAQTSTILSISSVAAGAALIGSSFFVKKKIAKVGLIGAGIGLLILGAAVLPQFMLNEDDALSRVLKTAPEQFQKIAHQK